MGTDLPQHRTTDQHFLSVMCELLDQQLQLLAEIRDRLAERETDGQPGRAGEGDGGATKLTEPATLPAQPAPDADSAVELVEPEQAPLVPEPTPPRKTARTTAAKKTTAATRRRTKGTS